MKEILEADKQLASSLWREVREMAEEEQSGRISPPFPFMDTYHPLEMLKLEGQEEARQRKLKLRGKMDRQICVVDQLATDQLPS